MIYLMITNSKDNSLSKTINITDYNLSQLSKTVDNYSKYCDIKLKRRTDG